MTRAHGLPIWIVLATLLLGLGCKSSSSAAKGPQRDTAEARQLNDRAFKLIGEHKYPEAEKMLRDAVAADPMYGPARNNLGLVYYHSNRLYEAAWEFENAIRLMPHQPEARNNLGLVLERAGKLTNAADSFATARDMEPDNPEYIGNLARARIRRGENDEQTQQLLEELILKDHRPQWNEWARTNLIRLRATSVEDVSGAVPTTQP